jgi:hypothetical protein
MLPRGCRDFRQEAKFRKSRMRRPFAYSCVFSAHDHWCSRWIRAVRDFAGRRSKPGPFSLGVSCPHSIEIRTYFRLLPFPRTFPWKSIVGPHFCRWAFSPLASVPQTAKFKPVLKDRRTPRELVASAPASVRRNKEKSAGSRTRHKGGHHHARQGPEPKSF